MDNFNLKKYLTEGQVHRVLKGTTDLKIKINKNKLK